MNKAEIKQCLDEGMSIKNIADKFSKGTSTIRYWLKKYELKANNNLKSWSDEEMFLALKSFDTIADVLRELGLTVRPGNYRTVRKFIKWTNADISHMVGKSHGKSSSPQKTLEEMLVKDSTADRGSLKRRILKESLLEDKCDICGITEWNNLNIVMVLDHINGVNDDHRLENLRFLCPNCNSQQPTFCRGQRKYLIQLGAVDFERKGRYSRVCPLCKQNKMVDGASKCQECRDKLSRKVDWPSKEELKILLDQHTFTYLGKKYGVSGNAVKKWAKKYGIYQRRKIVSLD